MRNRGLGLAFLAMIFVFPLLVSAVSPRPLGRSQRELRAGIPVLGTEMVLLGGLIYANRERRRLLELELALELERGETDRPRSDLSRPHPQTGAATTTTHPSHMVR